MDYTDLVMRLRVCKDDCAKCSMLYDEQVEQDLVREHCAAYEAADAIEALQRNLNDCRNELCLYCGQYKQRHNGACNGCRWMPKEEQT